MVFDLENGSGDAKLFWQKRSTSFRLDAVSHQSSTLVGETLIEGDAGLGAHCYWVVEDKVADALCYPRMGGGELSPRDAFLDGLPLFKILSADVDAEALSHSGDNKSGAFAYNSLSP